MKTFKENKKVWDAIYNQGKILDYPNENLVIFTSKLFKESQNKKLLDLGFGSGNNLIHLIKKGFKCYGCEVSSGALQLTEKRLKTFNLTAELRLLKDKIPYPDAFFDTILSWQVLYYNDKETLDFMLKEINRVLKNKGKFLVTLVRKNDIIVGCSDKITKNTYKVNSRLPSQEGAIIYVVDNQEEIKKLFNNFSNLEIGYFEYDFHKETGSHWVIYGEKI